MNLVYRLIMHQFFTRRKYGWVLGSILGNSALERALRVLNRPARPRAAQWLVSVAAVIGSQKSSDSNQPGLDTQELEALCSDH